jgi:hypothetical protein
MTPVDRLIEILTLTSCHLSSMTLNQHSLFLTYPSKTVFIISRILVFDQNPIDHEMQYTSSVFLVHVFLELS